MNGKDNKEKTLRERISDNLVAFFERKGSSSNSDQMNNGRKKGKTIVTLGYSNAGKTNYINAALAYMASYGCGGWKLSEIGNLDMAEVIDEMVAKMQKGQWMEKTAQGEKKEYSFALPSNLWKFHRETKVTINDWSGENFEKFNPEESSEFLKDCLEADGFMIFEDGGVLYGGNEENRTVENERKKMRSIMEEVMKGQKKRSYAIVVTKTDLFPQDYWSQNGKLDLSKLISEYKASHESLWMQIHSKGNKAGLFPVSLIPEKKYRKVSPEAGVGLIPSGQWDLREVMESTCVDILEGREKKWMYYENMSGAFQWILDSLFLL